MMICVLVAVDACWLGLECGYGRGSGRGRRKKVVGTGTAGLVETGASSSFLYHVCAVASDGWSENWNESVIQARLVSELKCRRCCKSELAHRQNLGIDPAFGPVICGAVERRDVAEAAAGSDDEPDLVADGDLEQT
jgi:hypothetical protein